MSYTSCKSLMIMMLAAPVIFLCSVQCANSQSQNAIYTYNYDSTGGVSTITFRLGNITARGFGVFNRITQIIQISHVFDINNQMVKVTGAAQ